MQTGTTACIGNSANGTLTVNAGSYLTSYCGYFGYTSAVTGSATIDGSNSTWRNSGTLYVGYSGGGAISITNGGALYGDGYIAYNSGSTGTVTIDGARSICDGGFYVGYGGAGSLAVTNGGAIIGGAGIIGCNSGASGTVTIDGAGSTWTSSELYVGASGNGTLNITNGGAVYVGGPTEVGAFAGSTGVINFGGSGGALRTSSLGASPTQVTGTGTITAFGLISDVALVFNSAASLNQTIQWNSLPNQNVTIYLGMAVPSGNGTLAQGGWGAVR